MRKALLHDPDTKPHFLRELSLFPDEDHVKGLQKDQHAAGIHEDHGNCNALHQMHRVHKGPRDQKNDHHLGYLGHRRQSKIPICFIFPDLKRVENAEPRMPSNSVETAQDTAVKPPISNR